MAALAGCGSNDTPLEEHPAGTALDEQPTLGPDPGTAAGTIVAFEDPSCPSCGRFERETFPELKKRLVAPGDVSFVFRAIPVVYDWAEPAVLALEAVHARDEAAFWPLKSFYYGQQQRLGNDNVRAATRRYLEERTDLDADAVLADVERATHRGDVETNLKAAEDAGVGGTPTFYLFSSGTFATKLVGPQSYDVFANSLGV